MIYRKTHNLITEEIRKVQAAIKQNSKDIKTAADHGDLKENAEYHAAKEEQVRLHDKLHRYEKFLHNEIAEPEDIDIDRVSFGTKVTYSDGEQETTVAVAGSAEYELELFQNLCTTSSPFGQRILGKQVGDVITLDLPAGEKRFEILKIELLS